jgi:hypothetical protein
MALHRIERKLNRIMLYLQISEEIDMAKWKDVRDAIARQSTVSASVIVYIEELKKQLSEWAAKPGGPSEDEVKAALNDLTKNTDELAAAIVVNTPAEDNDPLTVPAAVSGQPSTTYPDGVERQPFSTGGFPRDVDMSTPTPQGGEPQKPDET